MFEWTDLKAVVPMAGIVAAFVSVFVNSIYRGRDKKWEEYKERIINPIRINLKELKENRVEMRRLAYGEFSICIKNETIIDIIKNIAVYLTEIENICSRADKDSLTQERNWEDFSAQRNEKLYCAIDKFLQNNDQDDDQEDENYFYILNELIAQLEAYENGIEELIYRQWDKNYLNFCNHIVRKIKSKWFNSQAQV